ncbi:pseudouridine synthase [Dyadobacter flavalbus]|uniref:Pseudouridine synthase n=1 Tax=Dyadobacter flavalbus TaxID=2579942 RepID=A0A5M8QZK9_9BACT|nr:pseudouridine synthase [Dyadobacter flavalbus]KAA6440106.1 pseudouridine synthase [Dyadobacter flavalbus]
MRKRTNNPKEANTSRPSNGGQKTFRKSNDGTGRSFTKSRPQVESRFSKPSIKKSSFRVAASKPENEGQKARPTFDHEKSRSERPRFDKPVFTKSGSDKFGSGKPRPFRREDDSRGENDRREFTPRDRAFEPRDRATGNADKPRFERRGNERPSRDQESFRPRENYAQRERPSSERQERSRFERPDRNEPRESRSSESHSSRGRQENPDFKKKGDSNRSDRESPRRRSDESSSAEEDRSGLDRRVGRYESAPRYNLSEYEKKSAQKRKEKEEDTEIRLNRYIANAGICSRREADDLISSGQISVNGKTITEMGYKVKLTDVVKYGKKSLNPEKMVYILINKPKDYITTTDDPEERKTVLDLIQGACSERVYPVGRLDRNTTGLLLLTNDGELAEKLTHPSGGIKKIYQAELDKPITNEDFELLQHGLELEDGFIRPDEVGIVTPDAMVVGLEIHSGRNRIVRRMFEHLGYEVQKLDRTVFAGLNKKDLPRGKWRFLTEKEVIKLKFML